MRVEGITAGEVIRALDGRLAPMDCVSATQYEACEFEPGCGLKTLWSRTRAAILGVLDHTSNRGSLRAAATASAVSLDSFDAHLTESRAMRTATRIDALKPMEPESHSIEPAVLRALEGTWGAFEVAPRYSVLEIDEDTFPTFSGPGRSAREAKAYGVGLNWYWNKNVKFLFDYEHTDYEGGATGGDREPENAILTRVQIAY